MTVDIIVLIALLIHVESRGDMTAVGDGGKAIGSLQIHEVCVQDVNRIYGTKYSWPESAKDPVDSVKICELYLRHYCTEERIGRPPTIEDAARIWNGGPNGFESSSTDEYWLKVKKEWEYKRIPKESI